MSDTKTATELTASMFATWDEYHAAVRKQKAEQAAPAADGLPEPVAWVNRDDLDRMIDPRDTAQIYTYQDGWSRTALYTADQLRTAIDAAVAEARAETEALKSDIADALTTIAVYEAEARAVPVVTDNMVSRFLCWPLPRDFYPDCGISFDGRKDDEWNKNKTWPTGTNLLTAIQARQMLAHVLAATPSPAEQPEMCVCKYRPASECPGEWEPGCDLGANEKFVKVAEQPKPVALVREALDTVMALQWSGSRAHMDALHRLCQAYAALSGEQP